jgi:hypothetical protein
VPCLVNGRAKFVSSSLALLLAGCSAVPFWQKERRVQKTGCSSSVEVFTQDEAVARPHRVLRRVSTNCGNAEACVSTLVARACELKADAVIVDRSSWLRHDMAQPTYRGYQDPRRMEGGAPPSATPALGVTNVRVADGRLIVWLDK